MPNKTLRDILNKKIEDEMTAKVDKEVLDNMQKLIDQNDGLKPIKGIDRRAHHLEERLSGVEDKVDELVDRVNTLTQLLVGDRK